MHEIENGIATSSPAAVGVAARSPTFILASLLTSYPDETVIDSINTLMADEALAWHCQQVAPESWERLRPMLARLGTDLEAVLDLRSGFIDVFDRGRDANPLYESEYGARALVKTDTLVSLADMYAAFGFQLGANRHDMVDHIAIELEFYALLGLKLAALIEAGDERGVGIVLDACQKFLRLHLGRFPVAIAARPRVAGHDFFGPAMALVAALVQAECAALDVTPDVLDWYNDGFDADDSCCGSLGKLGGRPNQEEIRE